jgi:hypothetical protein
MEHEISAFSPKGVVVTHRPTATDAYAVGRQYEAEGFREVRIKTPDGTHYRVQEFYRVISARGSGAGDHSAERA